MVYADHEAHDVEARCLEDDTDGSTARDGLWWEYGGVLHSCGGDLKLHQDIVNDLTLGVLYLDDELG